MQLGQRLPVDHSISPQGRSVAFKVQLFGFVTSRFRPGFRLGSQTIQQPLDSLAEVFQAAAI
jgi:hypothetical protein